MQETISLVATLLATITFTTGFTLPGGFNNDSGEAVLAKKAAFLVFLIADTYAMCCSMLILFSIIWSMVYDSNRSSFLADRSLGLLKHSLYGTLVASTTGVYLVTYKKSMWIAIAVIIMCSLAVILSQRRILHKMFETMNSVTEKPHKMQMQLPSSWEQWTSYVKRGKQRPMASNNQGQHEEATPFTNQSEHQENTTPANITNEAEPLGEQSKSKLDPIVLIKGAERIMGSSSFESLKKAVEEQDLDLIRSAAACEQEECFNRLAGSEGNIFHIAAYNNNVEFMEAAMKVLHPHVVKSLLSQSEEDTKENPLHVAADMGHRKIVKLILDYYRSTEEDAAGQKPWLGLDQHLRTPLHTALAKLHERVALDILSMDAVLLPTIEDINSRSPLAIAMESRFNRVALQILTSSPNCSFSDCDGYNALFHAAGCSDQIFKLLLEKVPELIMGKANDGSTVLHHWVVEAKLQPLEHFLNSNVITSHLRRDFIDQLSMLNDMGNSPLQLVGVSVPDDALTLKIVQVLVNAYKQERAELFSSAEFQPPWLQKDLDGFNALDCAFGAEKEELALYLLSLDMIKFLESNDNLLFLAIECKCPKVAEEILRMVQQDARFVKLLTLDNGLNALHYAPKCTDIEGRQPLHLAALSSFEGVMVDILKLFLDASDHISRLWNYIDYEGNTPLGIAVSNKHEKLALHFLSLDNTLDGVEDDLLFEAIKHDCHQVVKFLLEWSAEKGNTKFLTSKENGKLIVERWPELINEQDKEGKTPLERASEVGTNWLVELILQKDRSCILNTPLAWVEACKRGHLSTVFAFAEKSSYFMDLCRRHSETPLHHIQDVHYKEYKALLDHEFIKELKNTQNSKGETPLHVAITSKNKDFAEILLRMDDVDRTIKDDDGKTAMELLEELCRRDAKWEQMCEIIGVDPTLRTTYVHLKADLTHMRDIISLVAALLATITFTVGFTLPGGFDSDSGEAILVKKAAFLVFLIADGYAMCTSMLVLFCIIWSMVCKREKSSLFIDRSLVLLKQSLYGTLLAFMSGVYTVIHRKSLWAAIVIFVMCSLVVVTANRSIMHILLPKLIPADDKDYLQWLCFWNKRKQKATPPLNRSEVQEREPLNNQRELELDLIV
ncbi:hypothetical protein Cgig2_028931 [Carnegiea gigantea]|uniref:PGG domain-containing protein n=1 Tax=Carnegiea gigantea TaxID=171969 RepID=A0A9Q1KQR9_9CARY|nr:hypothetical protein Cgig2_028931 [Carnegiea gigantea]